MESQKPAQTRLLRDEVCCFESPRITSQKVKPKACCENVVHLMKGQSDNRKLDTSEGIIVQASLDIIRKAAAKVLFEFSETLVTSNGGRRKPGEDVSIGDSILFEEDIKPCPPEIVVTKVAENTWYVISTSDIPTGGYPSGADAMRAAKAEENRLRIIKEFLAKSKGVKKVEDVRNWEPDMRAEAVDVLSIINSASRKWMH